MNERHKADPQYLAHLRWQVVTEVRRRARFGSSSPQGQRSSGWRAAALLAAGLLAGTAGTVAAGEIGRRQDRAQLLADLAIEEQLAATEASLLGDEQERIQRLAEAGVVTNVELDAARHESLAAHSRLQALELDRSEIQLSGEAPNSRLSAPLISGRDFVLERLSNDQGPLVNQVELRTSALERTQVQAQAGRATLLEEKKAERDLSLAMADLVHLEKRKELRTRFLSGELSASDLGLAARLQDARTERRQLDHRFDYARLAHEVQVERQAIGRARMDRWTEIDLARLGAQVDLAERLLQTLIREAKGLPGDLLHGSEDSDH